MPKFPSTAICRLEKTRVPGLEGSRWLLWVAAPAVLSVGCSVGPVNLVQDDVVQFETISSEAAVLWWAEAWADTNRTWVIGEVIRHREWPADRPGHVDLQVIGRNGPLAQAEVSLRPVRTAGGDTRRLAFCVPLASRPPRGSTVRVVHHAVAPAAADAYVSGCGNRRR